MFDFGKMITDFFIDIFTQILKFMIDLAKACLNFLGSNIDEISKYYNIIIGISVVLMTTVALVRVVSAILGNTDGSKQVTASNIIMDTIKGCISIPIMLYIQKFMIENIVVPIGIFLFEEQKSFTSGAVKGTSKVFITPEQSITMGGFVTILLILFYCVVIGFFFFKVSQFVVDLAFFNLSIPLVAVSIVTENMDYSREWWQKLLYSCLTMISQILCLTLALYGFTHLNKGMLYLMMSIGGGILIFRPPFVLDNLWTTTGMTKKGLTGGMRMGMNMFRRSRG